MNLLYSTNTQLKFALARDYFGALHYAWCSPVFDCRSMGRYVAGAAMPPSSDPASIYKELHEAVKRLDEHCAKIKEQRAVLKAVAVKLASEGKMSEADRDEVVQIVDRAAIPEWRPLIYIIPVTDALRPRVQDVPRGRRASREREFIVEGLRPEEFDVIEFPA